MTNSIEGVTIQFIKGEIEEDYPEVRLFRNNDGQRGQAIYKFYHPSSITIENFNLVKKMYLIDSEGEISTRKINLSISKKEINEVKSIFSWNSEKEFERYMRFAERYANSREN